LVSDAIIWKSFDKTPNVHNLVEFQGHKMGDLSMQSRCDIVAMGDICLDWYINEPLPYSFDELSQNSGGDRWTTINEMPGGSGLLFSLFAQAKKYKVHLIGTIGDDLAGKYIHSWLKTRGLSKGIVIMPNAGTAKVIIIYDGNQNRLLIANNTSCNKLLSSSDIEKQEAVISKSRLLYISGHCLMDPNAPRIAATQLAIKLAKKNGVSIALDVVPHEFYKIYPTFQQFQALTTDIDILITSVPTMRRILERGQRYEEVTKAMVEETINILSKYYDKLILRFGPHGVDYQAIWDRKIAYPIWQETQYIQTQDKRGYGDKLTTSVFYDIFKI
jgi:sugar/nucleoside kinase (ribokinase family)